MSLNLCAFNSFDCRIKKHERDWQNFNNNYIELRKAVERNSFERVKNLVEKCERMFGVFYARLMFTDNTMDRVFSKCNGEIIGYLLKKCALYELYNLLEKRENDLKDLELT